MPTERTCVCSARPATSAHGLRVGPELAWEIAFGVSSVCAYPVWYTPEAKLGETAAVVGEMPLWEMVSRSEMVAVFEFDSECVSTKEGGVPLPTLVRRYLK